MSYLCCLCSFAYSVVLFFVLCALLLPVSLDFPFLLLLRYSLKFICLKLFNIKVYLVVDNITN
jgi:hypothetical protein